MKKVYVLEHKYKLDTYIDIDPNSGGCPYNSSFRNAYRFSSIEEANKYLTEEFIIVELVTKPIF